MSEANKAVIKRYVEDFWNKGNVSTAEQFYAPDIVHHADHVPETRGIEGMKQLVTMLHKAFPDLCYTVEDVIAEGDKVVLRYSFAGTHKGEFLGIAGTGKQVKVTGTSTFRIAGGKIVTERVNWDALGMMQQLGIVTLPPSK